MRSFDGDPSPPSVYLGRHWCHSRDKIYQAFPLCFCILQVIKNWTVGRPGNEASHYVRSPSTYICVPCALEVGILLGRHYVCRRRAVCAYIFPVCYIPAMMPDLSAVWLPCQTPPCIWTPAVLLVTDQSARMLPGGTGQVITGTTGTYRRQQLIYSVYTQCIFVQWGTLPDICMLDCLVQEDGLCMQLVFMHATNRLRELFIVFLLSAPSV